MIIIEDNVFLELRGVSIDTRANHHIFNIYQYLSP